MQSEVEKSQWPPWLAALALPAASLVFSIGQMSWAPRWLRLVVVVLGVVGAVLIVVARRCSTPWRKRLCYSIAVIAATAFVLIAVIGQDATQAASTTAGAQSASPQSSIQASSAASSVAPTSSIASSITPPPTPLPPLRAPQEEEILEGNVGEFSDGAVIVGVRGLFSSFVALNITTEGTDCEGINFTVGERRFVAARHDGIERLFRITVMKITKASSRIRVEEVRPTDWPTYRGCYAP